MLDCSDEEPVTTLSVVLRDPRPISINVAYSIARNRVFLTKQGKEFASALKEAVSKATQTYDGLLWKTAVDTVYKSGGRVELIIVVFFPDLYNNTWVPGGSVTEKGKPRSPYKKKDASNYIKLIEDAVTDGTGIDDSANLDVTVRKRHDENDARIRVEYKVFE